MSIHVPFPDADLVADLVEVRNDEHIVAVAADDFLEEGVKAAANVAAAVSAVSVVAVEVADMASIVVIDHQVSQASQM